MNEDARLHLFMYLLLRDYLPSGQVAKIVQEVECADDTAEFIFTAKPIADYAHQLIDRIRVKPV